MSVASSELLAGMLLGLLLALAIAIVAHGLRAPQPHGAKFEVAARFGRGLAAAILAASAAWIVISPRADQPVLDVLERAFPAIRSAYMDDNALAIAAEGERRGKGDDAIREARSRARESRRFSIAAVFLVFAVALLVRPGAPSPRRRPGPNLNP